MAVLTLLRENSPLASPVTQRRVLETSTQITNFANQLLAHDLPVLSAVGLHTLQVNLGRICNQTCSHCHVDAGPDRRETMSQEVADACLKFL